MPESSHKCQYLARRDKKKKKTSTEDRTAEGEKFLLAQARNIILIVSMPPVHSNVSLLLCLSAQILSLN